MPDKVSIVSGAVRRPAVKYRIARENPRHVLKVDSDRKLAILMFYSENLSDPTISKKSDGRHLSSFLSGLSPNL